MKKPPRKIPTPQSLAFAALHYLERYAASEASLRRVLLNRLRRAAMDNPEWAADSEQQTRCSAIIENLIETHKRSGAVNDAAFTETKVNSLRRQGKSRRAIQQKLGAKGITSTMISDALAHHAEDSDPQEAELAAALALARKRKLGPFRQKPADDTRRRKDFATLARAGFASDIARKVLRQDSPPEYSDE